MNKFIFKKIILILLIIIIVILIVFSLLKNFSVNKITDREISVDNKEYCYYKEDFKTSGYSDVAWMKISENGNTVKGEFRNLPAETDSKVGLFTGLIMKSDLQNNIKTADVIWNTFAEGMNNKEQLIFDYGKDSAIVYFGEMQEEGEGGFFVFKNKNNLFPQNKMNSMDCLELEEKISVEQYIRENIKNISNTKEVLGGSWYVAKLKIDNQNNTGEVEYEDGHILEKASFDYEYDIVTKNINVLNFKQF